MGWELLLAVVTLILSVGGSVAAVSFRSGSKLTKLESLSEQNAAHIRDLITAFEKMKDKAEADKSEMHERINRANSNIADNQTATASILGELRAGLSAIKDALHVPSPPSRNATDQLHEMLNMWKLIQQFKAA